VGHGGGLANSTLARSPQLVVGSVRWKEDEVGDAHRRKW
jgi:hypothetical protein